MAAPVATGIPWPIAPPVSASKSCARRAAVRGGKPSPEVLASSTTIAPSGRALAIAAGRFATLSGPGRAPVARAPASWGAVPAADPIGERVQRGLDVLPVSASEHVHLAPVGHEVAAAAGIGEERHRRRGAGQDQVRGRRRAAAGLLRQVGEPLVAGTPAPRSIRAGNVSASTRAPVAAATRLAASSPAAESARPPSRSIVCSPAATASAAAAIADVGGRDGRRRRPGRGGLRALRPRHVGRQDQRRDLPAGGLRGRQGALAAAATPCAVPRGVDPAGHRARHARDVGLERRVVPLVVGRVRADDAQQRRVGAAGVVQVRQAVAQAGPEVQQHGGRTAGDPRVAVRRAGGDAFEQREHATHPRHRVQRVHEVHLGRAGVHEADLDTGVHQAGDQRLRPIHRPASPVNLDLE